jgi:hypothetical protein
MSRYKIFGEDTCPVRIYRPWLKEQETCTIQTPTDAQIAKLAKKAGVPLTALKAAISPTGRGNVGRGVKSRAAATIIVTLLAAGAGTLVWNPVSEFLIVTGILPELCGTGILARIANDLISHELGGRLTCEQKSVQWRASTVALLAAAMKAGITPAAIKRNFAAAVDNVERLLFKTGTPVKRPSSVHGAKSASPSSSAESSSSEESSSSSDSSSASPHRPGARKKQTGPPTRKQPAKKASAAATAKATRKSSKDKPRKGRRTSPKHSGRRRREEKQTRDVTEALESLLGQVRTVQVPGFEEQKIKQFAKSLAKKKTATPSSPARPDSGGSRAKRRRRKRTRRRSTGRARSRSRSRSFF